MTFARHLKSTALAATLLAAPVAAQTPAPAKDAPGYRIVDRVPLPNGWWDNVTVEPVNRQLFVARGNGVFKLDLDRGLHDLRFIPGLEGRAVVPVGDGGMMLTTMSGYSAAILFSTVKGEIAKVFWMSQPADGAVYEPVSKRAWVLGAHGRISAVDPEKLTIETVAETTESFESAATDGKGRIFIASSSSNAVVAFDTVQRKIAATWKLAGCENANGIAYIADTNLIATVCFNKLLKILDATTGAEIASLPVGSGSEAVIHDPTTDRIFIPAAYEGYLSVFKIDDRRTFRLLEQVPTQVGTRTGAVDPKTSTLYLPTGRMGPYHKLGWPEPLPGTVELLVMKPR